MQTRTALLSTPQTTGSFHGWRIACAAFVTFGVAVGIPYYNIGFFYDYFQRMFGWQRSAITLGFPLAALLTIWVGPVVMHRFSPRKLILAGTGFSALAFCGFGCMRGSLALYYALWVVYMLGYICAGPVPHQILISYWFRRNRGKAMGIVFAGVALLGSAGSILVAWLTHLANAGVTLIVLAAIMLLTWPVALFILKDRPAEMGQHPDGDPQSAPEILPQSITLRELLRSGPFWLLLAGSTCSIGAIGAINFHMKFVFLDAGFAKGLAVDNVWRTASVLILVSSIAGRLLMGALADNFSRKGVMIIDYLLVATTIPLLLIVRPQSNLSLFAFATLFGFGMGADYMLIPLVAAEQFGVNNLARVAGIIIPVTIIGQSWFPYFVSILREFFGNYWWAMNTVLAVAVAGAVTIMLLPAPRSPARSLH